MRQSLLSSALLACSLAALTISTACSVAEGDVKEAAYKAQGEGDHEKAAKLFGLAIKGKDASHPEYVELLVGRSMSLASADAEAAKALFMGAVAEKVKFTLRDYSMLVSSLTTAGKFLIAIDILEAGVKQFPDDPNIDKMKKSVASACEAAGSDAGTAKLAGLGYL